ncbi:RNA-dependent RNA polymerase 2 [Wolffia australiana]
MEMAMAQATVSVSRIPKVAIAEELVVFFDRVLSSSSSSALCPVFACEIFSWRAEDWDSRGEGRVQFETSADADEALRLHSAGRLGAFLGSHLALSRAHDDVVARAGNPSNRLVGVVLSAGFLAGDREMAVLESWGGVRAELMPEREKLELFVVAEESSGSGGSYRLDIMFSDIIESLLCSATEPAILLKLRFAPRIYEKVSGPLVRPRFKAGRYHFCKENLLYRWVRTVDFSSSRSFGRSSCLCLQLPGGSCKLEEAIKNLPLCRDLGELFGITPGSTTEILDHSSEFPPIISRRPGNLPPLPYEIFFQLNQLLHTQKISVAQINAELFSRLGGLEKNIAGEILTELRRTQKSTCFDPLRFVEEECRKRKNRRRKSSDSSIPDAKMNCHRALVTPSRVYLLGPELELSNYVINHFKSRAADFLRVSFADEDWSKLSSNAISAWIEAGPLSEPRRTGIHRRILSVLRDGLAVDGKKFEFLAFSASQLRGNSAWMFASDGELSADEIRRWMGRFERIRSVSKCAARMGQLFSASILTVQVPREETETIPDVESWSDYVEYCFSDGIGKISPALADQVAERCGLSATPSAFQIRYGGYKGVVAVDRSSENKEEEKRKKKLSLRKSMLKFDSDRDGLSVTRWSESLPCFLNREIIVLLSTLGVSDEAFEALQRRGLSELDEMLERRETAMKLLEGASSAHVGTARQMLSHGYEPRSEAFLWAVLRARRDVRISEMESKSRIFVPRGRVLLGCLDEARVLDYGQVFARVTMSRSELQEEVEEEDAQGKEGRSCLRKMDEMTGVVVGKVIVTKNPCLHPGDIRILDAVRHPVLEQAGLVDVVVFPQRGKRPHPNECSGGDLDGDLYFVCWDKTLVPPAADEPTDYFPRRPRITDHDVTIEEIQRFFVEYMADDTLGAISTAHLVHSDLDPCKARSDACCRLARLHSVAVDFAKSGSPAEMPRALKPRGFPDFMARPNKPVYASPGVLGKLHCAVRGLLADPAQRGPAAAYDPDLEVQGFECFLGTAKRHRALYAVRMREIMKRFGVESEAEAVAGEPGGGQRRGWWGGGVEGGAAAMVAAAAGLREEARGWLRDWCAEGEQARLASAWYHVTYHTDHYVRGSTFLSFPWAAADVLLHVKSLRRHQRNLDL